MIRNREHLRRACRAIAGGGRPQFSAAMRRRSPSGQRTVPAAAARSAGPLILPLVTEV